MDETKKVNLVCIFCHSTNFELASENYKPKEDEHIKCATCGKLNIYADIKNIAIDKGKEKIVIELNKMIENIKIF